MYRRERGKRIKKEVGGLLSGFHREEPDKPDHDKSDNRQGACFCGGRLRGGGNSGRTTGVTRAAGTVAFALTTSAAVMFTTVVAVVVVAAIFLKVTFMTTVSPFAGYCVMLTFTAV